MLRRVLREGQVNKYAPHLLSSIFSDPTTEAKHTETKAYVQPFFELLEELRSLSFSSDVKVSSIILQ